MGSADPLGTALGQIIAPFLPNVRFGVGVLIPSISPPNERI